MKITVRFDNTRDQFFVLIRNFVPFRHGMSDRQISMIGLWVQTLQYRELHVLDINRIRYKMRHILNVPL